MKKTRVTCPNNGVSCGAKTHGYGTANLKRCQQEAERRSNNVGTTKAAPAAASKRSGDDAVQMTGMTSVEGKRLRGGSSNSYYSDASQRQIVTCNFSSPSGYWADIHAGRINPNTDRIVCDTHIASTGIYETEAERDAYVQSDEVQGWLQSYSGRYNDSEQKPRPDGMSVQTPNVCRRCGVGSISLAQEGYGDRMTCTNDECDYEAYHSIGD